MRHAIVLTLTFAVGCAQLRYPTTTMVVANEPSAAVPHEWKPVQELAPTPPRRNRHWRGLVIGGAVMLTIGVGLVVGGVVGYERQDAINRAQEASCAMTNDFGHALGCSIGGIFDGLSLAPYVTLLTVGTAVGVSGLVLGGLGEGRREDLKRRE